MISNVSIQEYARLAHLFRKALDESYAESKLKNYPIFSLFPQGTCGDCSCLLSRFIVEHNLPEPTYIAGERADGSTHAWLEFTIPSSISPTINLEHCLLSISEIMTFQILISVSK